MKITRLSQAYDFPGFKARSRIHDLMDNPAAVVVDLRRTFEKKDQNVPTVVPARLSGMTAGSSGCVIITADILECTSSLRSGACSARSAAW